MSSKYVLFKTPRYCPNAIKTGYARPFVKVGDLIEFREPTTDPNYWNYNLGRVLGLVKEDGRGVPYTEPLLLVLTAHMLLTHGMERHVKLDEVTEVQDPGAFTRWFLFGKTPPPQLALDVIKYGAMSNHYLAEYLDSPEGSIRPDWHEIAMRRWRKNESRETEGLDAEGGSGEVHAPHVEPGTVLGPTEGDG